LAWRWGNIPIPEAHLAGLGAGILLHVISRRVASDPRRPGARDLGGQGGWRRRPGVAWALGYVGVALVADTAWPLLLLPVVLAATDVVVRREERSLERRFGAAYWSYRASVRRYL
jgi:protein-S-isoprenylcysteine O-methyltransferase Ste14